MKSETPPARLEPLQRRLAGWSVRLRTAGLDGLVAAVLDAAEPLGPIGAQVLWVTQPVLGLIMPADEIGELAHLLDDPKGVAWLRAELIGSQRDSEDT